MKTRIGAFIITLILTIYSHYTVPASPLERLSGTEKQVPVIMYHNILNKKSLLGKFVISPEELEQDLIYLKQNGFQTVVISDLISFVYDRKSLPDKPIILTFDDGDYAVYRYLFPLLEKYDMKAVVSIIGKVTDDYSSREQTGNPFPNLTWEQIKELVESNRVELQNHTYDMHKNNGAKQAWKESGEAYSIRLTSDLNTLQNRMKEMIGIEASALTYPFGSTSSSSDNIIKSIGFKASLSCNERVNTLKTGQPDCLFSLGRFNRPHGISTAKFFSRFIVKPEKSFFE